MQRIVHQFLRWSLSIFLLTAIGCTKDQSQEKNTLIVALGSQPSTLDPRFATDANGMRIGWLIFNSLVRIGPNLEVVGDLAESWTYKDLVYTFKLHPNLTFSNGRPVKKEDILFSFAQYRAPNNPFHSGQQTIEKVEVNEEGSQLTVKIHLKEFSAKLLNSDLPIVKILPKKETLDAGEDFSQVLIGTGSFRFKNQSANQIILEARKDHPFAPPQVDQLTFKVIRDEFTRFQKTLKGTIDIAQNEIPAAKVSEFEERKDQFHVYKYPGLSMSYILVNLKDPVLKDLKVRQALAQAINRKEIIDYKLEGLATEATSVLTPHNPFFNESLKNIPYNKEAAQKIVEKLEIKGEIQLKTSNSQSAIDNARVLANQMKQAGFNIKLQSYEWGTYYSDIRKGQFQLATMKWIGALDPDIYRIAFHSGEKPPGRNRGHYVNPEFDRLVEQGLKIEDEEERIRHYHKVQKMIHKDLAIIPLWYDRQVAVVNRRVKGYEPPQNGDYSPFINVSKE